MMLAKVDGFLWALAMFAIFFHSVQIISAHKIITMVSWHGGRWPIQISFSSHRLPHTRRQRRTKVGEKKLFRRNARWKTREGEITCLVECWGRVTGREDGCGYKCKCDWVSIGKRIMNFCFARSCSRRQFQKLQKPVLRALAPATNHFQLGRINHTVFNFQLNLEKVPLSPTKRKKRRQCSARIGCWQNENWKEKRPKGTKDGEEGGRKNRRVRRFSNDVIAYTPYTHICPFHFRFFFGRKT